MNCVQCSAELAPGGSFCGACGMRQPPPEAPKAPPAPVACGSCGTALPPGGRFCMQCGTPAAAPSAAKAVAPVARPAQAPSSQAPSLVAAYEQGFAHAEPEPTPQALAEYESIFHEYCGDGVMDAEEAADLVGHRRRLGIPERVHRELMRSVAFEGVPARLRFDIGRAHYVVGEMAQAVIELQPVTGQLLKSFVIHYRTTIGDRAVQTYRHPERVLAQGVEFALSLEPPSVAGAHKLEALLFAEFSRGVFRARFDLPPLMFDPAASNTGPQQVSMSINVDNSSAAAGQQHFGTGLLGGPARTTGGVQLGGGDWHSQTLRPISEAGANEWLSPTDGMAPPRVLPPRVQGSPLRCRGIYLNLWRASERPREVWWLRDDEVSFGRFHDPATNADLELVMEPRSNAAHEEQNVYLSRRHLALRRTDRGAVVVGLSSGQRPCTLNARPLAGGASSEPLPDGRVEVTAGLSLELTCLRNAHGDVEVVQAARRGNVEHRAYLLAGRGLGMWEDRAGFLGLLAADGAPAPVALVWHDGSPALRNVSASGLQCDKKRVPVGECRYLAAGQLWTIGGLTLEVTDEVVRERS